MSEMDSVYEQEYDSDSTTDINVPPRSHKSGKSGKQLREEPTSLAQCMLAHLQWIVFTISHATTIVS